MKRAFLIHGWGGSSQSDFFPWLKPELEKLGYEVHAPDMPDTEKPTIDTWIATLAKLVGTPDQNTYFVGHSIGCQAILRYLETIDSPIGGAVFVAGWFNLENLESDEEIKIAKPWIETPINTAKIKSVLPASTLIISDNDPYGCLEENKKKFAEITTREVVVPSADHFNPEDGYTEIPLVVKELLGFLAPDALSPSMPSRSIKTTCCIAGGGPAGILLGYLLARAGIEVTVLEMWPDFFRDFRGDTIHPSTMDTLQELGLLDEFLKLPHNEMTRMTMHVGGKTITMANFEHVDARCKFIAFIPQWDFLNFISAKARQFPSFHLMMETKATDLIKESGRVVGVRAQDKQGELEIRADLTVGADGRHSTVREKGDFVVKELGAPIDVLWFRIGRGGMDDKQSLGYLDSGRALIMLDRSDYWQCGLVIPKGGFDAIKAAGLEAFHESIASLARVPASVMAEVDSWDKVKLLSVAVDRVRQWASDGVALIGDSAHAMSPIGGVGINYAIQDAVAAANILIPAVRKNNLSLTVLNKVQERREKPTRRMQGLQVYIQNHIFSPLLNKKTSIKVPWIFSLVEWFPILQRIPGNIVGIGFQPEHIAKDLI